MNYTKRLEGPDGQYIVLLTRVPYDNALAIEEAFSVSRAVGKRADAVMRNLVVDCEVRDYLSDERTDDVGRADPFLMAEWRDQAIELYLQWRKDAMPGPKGRTPATEPTEPPPETDEPS